MYVYCMKLDSINGKDKTFYKALCYSCFGFMFDLFLPKDVWDNWSDKLEDMGFCDVTNFVSLRYNKKSDKLEYYLKK